MAIAWTRPKRIALGIVLMLVAAIAVFVLVFDWNWLKSPLQSAVANATGRTLEIRGDISGQFRLHPRIRFEQVRLSNPEWARSPDMLLADAVEMRIALLPLLRKMVVIHDLVLERPELHLQRLEDSRATWVFNQEQQDKGEGSTPIIEQLRVDRATVHFIDALTKADMVANLEDQAGADDPRSLKFRVEGKFQAQPLELAGETAGLLVLRNVEQTIPVLVKGTLGDSRIAIEGDIQGLVTFERANLNYDVRGASLALMGPYFGVPLPETPKFSAAGFLSRDGNTWRTTDLKGQMGKSDVAGTVTVVTGGERPQLEADLTSSNLDLADLGPLIGGTNRSRYKPTPKDESLFLPNRAFEFDTLDKLDARVQVRAKRVVRVADWPFDNFRADFRLKDQQILLEPIEFGMAGGKLAGRAELDARKQPVSAVLTARMAGVRVAEIAPQKAAVGEAAGILSGRVDLRGQGNSISSLLGGANGRLTLLLAEGNVPGLLPALIDLDGARVLAKLVGSNPESVRCSAVDIVVKNGVATPNVAVVETDTTVLTLTGQLNLKSEQIDMKLTQAPKKPSFLSLRTPIVIGGTLVNPELGPDAGPLAARGAAALLLGLVNPLAAALALIETGPGEDGTCPVIQRGYQARSQGADQARSQGAEQGLSGRATPPKEEDSQGGEQARSRNGEQPLSRRAAPPS
jgi:uncharacterized protein involved in outer membrane biogenesis